MFKNRSGHRFRIAFVANTDYYLYHFRSALIKELVARGVEVYTVAPKGEFVSLLGELGTTFIPWSLERSSFNPAKEFRSLASLILVYKNIRPTLAHHFTIKPNIYGPIAAKMNRVSLSISSITGLGYIFTGNDAEGMPVRSMISWLNRIAFSFSDAITFQNRDDQDTFRNFNIMLPTSKVHFIPGGSGINTAFFNPLAIDKRSVSMLKKNLGVDSNTFVVLLIGRMLWHKGIGEFVECSRVLKGRYPVKFLLVGPEDNGNLASIPLERLLAWENEGCIQYLNMRRDIRELLALSDVVVLPSYREGIPRVLLEAAAMGKPIVATDVPGCRDVVDHGTNGFLVQSKDSNALALAIEQLLLSEEMRQRFGDAGRRKAVQEFDEGKLVSRMIDLYDVMLKQKGMHEFKSQ